MSRRVHWTATAIASLAALFLVVAASAGNARGPKLSLTWKTPTPPDGSTLTVSAGQPFTLELAAASNQPQLVLIGKRKLPAGATFTSGYGTPGIATVAWTPTAEQVGEHVMTFGAKTHDLPYVYARPRSFIVYVLPATPNGPNEPFSLSGPNGLSRWAHIDRQVAARTRPSAGAKVITRLRPLTPELTANLTLTLAGQINEKGEYWVRVRLPVLPNGTTGWVPRSALGPFRKNYTRLVIDRAVFTATLYRRGVAVFKTRVGVGKSFWPTPTGEFHVRNRLTGFSDLIYGPIAFGTNARSAVLTDWPGGASSASTARTSRRSCPARSRTAASGCRMPRSGVFHA